MKTANLLRVTLLCAIAFLSGPARLTAQIIYPHLYNPHWSIIVDDHAYSDLAFDQRPGFEGREYLSGEWAAAIAYTLNATPTGPLWLNPEFSFPDWTANSDFVAEAVNELTGQTNAWGFPIARSCIANSSLRIGIQSEMIDTTNGIPQGLSPKTAPSGSNILSDRYVFRQKYSITNISGTTLTSVRFFKFLHSLQASTAVYDDRAYAGTLDNHRYVISQKGKSPDFWVAMFHEDVVALHADAAPDAWEVGYFGIDTVDDHAIGKPSIGVHWSIEADSLSGEDDFAPTNKWVGGAIRQPIGTLAPNASTNLQYLMTVHTVSSPIPLRISRSDTALTLSWPIEGGIWSIYTADVLGAGVDTWELIDELDYQLEEQGDRWVATLPLPSGTRFYALGF